MLSWSAAANHTPVRVEAVVDPSLDPSLPGGAELIRFVDAVLRRSPARPAEAAAVRSLLGESALINAASVLANFQMMNRVADATGMPVGKGSRIRNAELISRLGLERFDHLESGPPGT